MMENANLTTLGLNLMRPWKEALAEYLTGAYAAVLFDPSTLTLQGEICM
jgi:hypothetical protein